MSKALRVETVSTALRRWMGGYLKSYLQGLLVLTLLACSFATKAEEKREFTALAYDGFLPLPEQGIKASALMDLVLNIGRALPAKVTPEQLAEAAAQVEDYYRSKGVDFVEISVSSRASASGVVWLTVDDLRKPKAAPLRKPSPKVKKPAVTPRLPIGPRVPPQAAPAYAPLVVAPLKPPVRIDTSPAPAAQQQPVVQNQAPVAKKKDPGKVLSTPQEEKFLSVETPLDLSALLANDSIDIDLESFEQAVAVEKARLGATMSLEDLYSIADALTKVFRNEGYKFHTVYVPVQKMGSGDPVKLWLLEGKLGDVHVRGDDAALNEDIASRFNALLGRALYQPDVDQLILGLKSQYGLSLLSYYSRGSKQGEVRLNIKVKREEDVSLYARLDNYGNDTTGRDRLLGSLSWHGVLGQFDSFSLGIQQAVDGEKNSYGSIDYRSPLGSLDHVIGLSLSNNLFQLGDRFDSLELEGDARTSTLSYRYTPLRSFSQSHAFTFSFSDKSNDYDSPFNDPLLEQDEESQSASVGWLWQIRPVAAPWQYGVSLVYTGGNFDADTSRFEQSFDKLQLNQQLQVALGKPGSAWYSSFRWSLRTQYTEHNLSSFESFSMTGAYGVRGFKAGYFSAERGALSSLEWWLPSLVPSWNSVSIMPFLFVDGAYGERLTESDTPDTRVVLGSAGLGLQLDVGKQWQLSLVSGASIKEKNYDNPEPEELSLLVRLDWVMP